MLTLRILPRNINQFIKQSSQQLHTSVKLLTAKDSSYSSSSSSDSSDSDSDREDNKVKKADNVQTPDNSDNILNTTVRLQALLNQMSIKESSQKKKQTQEVANTIKVAIKPKADRYKKAAVKEEEKKPFEELLISSAKNVAKVIKGDAKKNELELLSRVLNLNQTSSENEKSTAEEAAPASAVDLSYIISGMKVEESKAKVSQHQERRQMVAKKVKQRFQEPSISQSLLHAKTVKFIKSKAAIVGPELKVAVKTLGIFTNLSEDKKSNAPSLETWDAMETREMKLSVLTPPQNVFEEMIQWTDQGKLWHFPINNEQGMEEEEKVHFSEHVFMERHLRGWCPKRGPIRHFMELVCTGLSKNPYMTVQEKVGHITWYKNYFEDKKALLDELGVLDDMKVSSLESKEKKEIEA